MSIQELGIPTADIAVIFGKHERQLLDTLRYDRFRVTETPGQWELLLGPDVVLLTHPKVVAQIAEDFVSYEGVTLTDEEQTLFSTAPWIHDLGELIIESDGIGDVSFDQKTDAHEKKEILIFDAVLNAIPNSATKRLIKRAYQDVVIDRHSELGRMFNVVERIGYLLTAVRAYKGVDGNRIQNWKGLVGNVLSNQIMPLLNYASEFAYVSYVLFEDNRQAINSMFEETQGEAPPDRTGNPSFDPEKLRQALLAWQDMLK